MALLALTLVLAALADPPAPPEEADDPFLWLEEAQGPAALDQVRAWNAATMARYEADPRFATFRSEALEILTSEARLPSGSLHGPYLDGLWRDAEHPRGLWRRIRWSDFARGGDDWTVLLDLDALEVAEQANWVWHGATCAPGGIRCLVKLSHGGTDAAVVRELDTATGAFVDGGFALPEAKSDLTWLDADTLLVGTDRGEGTLTSSGYPRTVVRWARGTALEAAPVVAEGEVSDVSVRAFAYAHGRQRYAFVSRAVSFFENELSYAPEGRDLVRLPLPLRSRPVGVFRGQLLALLREDHAGFAAGSLVAVDLDTLATSLVLEPGPGESIEEVEVGAHALAVAMLSDVVGRLRRLRWRHGGWQASDVALPDHGAVAIEAASDELDDLLVSFESLTVPKTLYRVDRRDRATALRSMPSFYDASDVVVEQRFAPSADGTPVPYFVMARRDVLGHGPAPTIQYGYGGFLAAILPSYFSEAARPQHGAFAGRIWVRRGGVLVLSNIRGGSEYGPAWHTAAMGPNRQRAFDDFYAIAEDLVADGVTTPAQLGAIGRSNGGLLMGVAFTQRPDLYAAIDCGVPLLDMLRYTRIGAGASWIGEYGDPDVPEQRAALAAWSPYQHLRAGADYPALLLYTSTLDDRVHPAHARKFAAALEQLGVPFDWWENIEGGHGGVANQEQSAERIALELAFMARELHLGDNAD